MPTNPGAIARIRSPLLPHAHPIPGTGKRPFAPTHSLSPIPHHQFPIPNSQFPIPMPTYRQSLFPWCIIRSFPNARTLIIGRFRRRGDAEAQLQVLQKLMPGAVFSIMFDGSIR